MTIGVVTAMQCEADLLLRDMDVAAREVYCSKTIYMGKVGPKDVALVLCGVGKVNAAIGAQTLLDLYHARVLFNFGVAGSVRDNTEIAKVYQIEKAVQFDFDLTTVNGTRIGTLDECRENFLPLAVLPQSRLPLRALATADRFNDDRADLRLLQTELNADIRDMEGGAVAQVAMHASVPCHIWKAVSDKAGSGSTVGQYRENKLRALQALQKELPALFALLPDGGDAKK